ncbi:HYC_CC_PP family protein [Sediminibacterium soli]
MRKLIILILSIVYLNTTVGATIHMHYCMDKLVDWRPWHTTSKKCSECGMEKTHENKKGCCKDEHKQVKLQIDHKAAENFQLQQLSLLAVAPACFVLPAAAPVPSVTEQYPISHAPPRCAKTSVYIRNCVFLI